MINEYITTLMNLTTAKEKVKIKELLEQISNTTEKGIVFEEYIKMLYAGNGWIAIRKGSTRDCGVDVLLFHPKSPQKVAMIIQSKNHIRALNFDATKTELNKFEDKGRDKYNCNSFMLISINGFVKDAEALERYNMKLENWDKVASLIDTYDINGKSEPQIELYAHNKIAYERAKELFKQTNKVDIVQATGTGKSYIIIKFISELFDKKFLILVPQKYIIQQIKSNAQWITQNTIFMTYAKLKNLTGEEMKALNLDFIVLDEFHRCGAELWGKGVKRLLGCYNEAYILGTSATPIRYLDHNRDMSDELFEGNIAVNLSLSEALVRRILPMPIYISALYTLDDELNILQQKIQNNIVADTKVLTEQVLEYKKNWEKSKGIPQILRKYINGDNLKFIVFCENKEHLSEMQWLVEMWFVKAKFNTRIRKYVVINGSKANDKELDDFKSNQNIDEIKLLFTIDMLNEGVHISGMSGVILLRTTQSPRIFYQQIGRAIEAGNDSNQPLIFDFVNNFNSICADNFLMELNIARENEKKLRNKLGLAENCPPFSICDETKNEIEFFKSIEDKLTNIWSYRYEELVNYKNMHGDTLVSSKDKDNGILAKWVRQQRSSYRKGQLNQDRTDKLNSIGFSWNAKDTAWQRFYKKLVEYYKKNGHCMVKRTEDNSLSQWVVKQRQYYNSGSERLNRERIDALNRINFQWSSDAIWLFRYQDLVEYKNKFGISDVPRRYKTKNIALGSWAVEQRMARRDGLISEEQIKLLDDLGFSWDVRDANWNEMFNQLLEFKNVFGYCNVSRHDENNKKLAHWVEVQRKCYRSGKLSSERFKKLEEIGFDFSLDAHDAKWSNMFNELLKFKNVFGHCYVPRNNKDYNKKLAHWVEVQRKCYRSGKLSAERFKKLEEIGFDFVPRKKDEE